MPGATAAPEVGPATPARGSGPEKLPFTPDTIREIVRAKQPEIEHCWEQIAGRYGQAGGRQARRPTS